MDSDQAAAIYQREQQQAVTSLAQQKVKDVQEKQLGLLADAGSTAAQIIACKWLRAYDGLVVFLSIVVFVWLAGQARKEHP